MDWEIKVCPRGYNIDKHFGIFTSQLSVWLHQLSIPILISVLIRQIKAVLSLKNL